MLSWWWPKPKLIKHVAAHVGSAHQSGWNVTLYLLFKRYFSFFYSISKFPHQSFCSPFDPNAIIKWSTKVQKVSRLRDLKRRTSTATPAAFNITQTHLKFLTTALLTEAAWPENHQPTYITLLQRQCFSFPVSINFGWSRKSVIHPFQHKYWNVLLLDFHFHSTHINFPKFNSFLSI